MNQFLKDLLYSDTIKNNSIKLIFIEVSNELERVE